LATLPNSGGDYSEENDWTAPQTEGHKCFLATHHTMQHYSTSGTDKKRLENKKNKHLISTNIFLSG
jgi:hypothetical protein